MKFFSVLKQRAVAKYILGTLALSLILCSPGFAADKQSKSGKSKSSKRDSMSDYQCCSHKDECYGLSVAQCCRSNDVSGCCCPSGGKASDDLGEIEKRLKAKPKGKKSSEGNKSKSYSKSKSGSSKKKSTESLGESLNQSISEASAAVE